ncbi:hypothetical protein CAEBREN_15129 [Caenorhabditis brenneri]|uniref:Sdz-33 F-box domain-containing protein n=1 Tax=Caenorhabditis brenneri TaxID=135651 RepID=G0NPJ1_CAEBE|nr:hypothetical protein CAEBREN_15129 [Caenorhabditis brenneri]
MPFDFLGLTYPSIKNVVAQMSNVDAVRVSLQNAQADQLLKTGGKADVSFFKLSEQEISRLSDFDKLELFLCEAERSNSFGSQDVRLSCYVSEQYFLFRIERDGEDYVTVGLGNFGTIDELRDHGVRKNMKFGNELVPTVTLDEIGRTVRLILFWEDRTAGLCSMINFFHSKFNRGLKLMQFCNASGEQNHSEAIRKIVEYVNSNNVQIAVVECVEQICEEDYKFFLENLTPTFVFDADAKTSPEFKFDGQMRCERIRISSGHWFTLDVLLKNANRKVVVVQGADYTKEELVTFLEHWKDGKFSELEQLELETKAVPADVVKDFEKLEGQGFVLKGPDNKRLEVRAERKMFTCYIF